MDSPPTIRLHIDRLILDGLPFTMGDAGAIRAEIEAELARVLGETDLPTQSLAVEQLAIASFTLPFAAKPARLGQEFAATLGALLTSAPTHPDSTP